MDLPLSKPFLKILACYGSTNKNRVDSGEEESLKTDLSRVMNAEACRERIFLSEDPLFLGHNRNVGRHWLTGLLDFEDFALIQPERAKFFRQLLCLYAVHKSIRSEHSLGGHFCLEESLDDASVEILNCTIKDLCINMEFLPDSPVSLEILHLGIKSGHVFDIFIFVR